MNNEEKIAHAQLKKINLEIEKLEAEKVNLKSESNEENRLTKYLPLVVTTVIAIASLLWGIVSFISSQQAEKAKEQAQGELASELAGKESRNIFYQKQLEIYLDLTKTAAQISLEKDNDKTEKLHEHFLELYRGNLEIVRDGRVKVATIEFEKEYKEHKESLDVSAEKLANACRSSLGNKWSIPLIEKDDN